MSLDTPFRAESPESNMPSKPELTRRLFALGMASAPLMCCPPAWAVDDLVAAIERRHGGRLGVFALDTGSGHQMAHRADERFLLCSTFKGPLAAHVLALVDRGDMKLDSMVAYGSTDLLVASPITRANVDKGALSIGALCAAVLQVSDNTAANLLLSRTGGPQALTAFVRTVGDEITQFDRYETQVGKPSGTLDTTTPRAIAGTAGALLLGNRLSPTSRAQLEAWMVGNEVGRMRMRASLPLSWTAADRTGTDKGQCDEFAVVRRPDRPPIIVAAYYDAVDMETEPQEAVLREVGAAVVAWAGSVP